MNDVRELEFELRRLVGVAAVGFEHSEQDVVVHVLLHRAAAARSQDVRRQVAQRVRAHLQQPVVVEVEVVPDVAASRPPRVQVIAVRPDQLSGGVEIHLAHRGQRTIGRGATMSPSAAAGATLEALANLGASLPFRVDTLDTGADGDPVVVVARSDDDDWRHYGVASGRTPEDAACRAALHALNRYLEREGVFAASPGGRREP